MNDIRVRTMKERPVQKTSKHSLISVEAGERKKEICTKAKEIQIDRRKNLLIRSILRC